MASFEQSRLIIQHMNHALADHPDAVIVTFSGIQPRIVFRIKANPNDTCKLIGRDGRMADAIRNGPPELPAAINSTTQYTWMPRRSIQLQRPAQHIPPLITAVSEEHRRFNGIPIFDVQLGGLIECIGLFAAFR